MGKKLEREEAAKAFLEFVDIVAALRNPQGGCPWDLEQTHRSLRPYLIEESYEALEAIDAEDDPELVKELGDVLLQVVLHAQVAADRDAFTVFEVLRAVSEKMVRRHPHVFGTTKVGSTEEVLKNWEALKKEESGAKNEKKRSVLDGVPSSLPALLRAQRLGEKAANVGFDWSSIEGVWDKVNEEISELQAELCIGEDDTSANPSPSFHRTRVEEELGDLLFSLAQYARWLGVSAEDAARGASERFNARFRAMEDELPEGFSDLSSEQLDAAWARAKERLTGK